MEHYTYLDGVRIDVPQDVGSAHSMGWHKGVDYNYSFQRKYKHNYDEVVPWCRANLDPYLLQTFGGSIWFYRESDAMLCRLKWE